MAATPEQVLDLMRETRRVLSCLPSLGDAWQVVWLEGKRRGEARNGREGLRRLVARKRANLDTLYEPGSDLHLLHVRAWAELAWVLEQIDAAAGEA
ncbi:MAG: hypothetical protein A2Z99_08200 [Treponema sp. GWB1_62_6]|nr:MAG: hypothetical protein A2Z99_08200 [Treponema sp. GWB1_62_6]